ncbi:MAG: hypothetical protein PHC66_01190 [Candidatus Nanoarchaeia archaeon]|nr:hypothetical protein [Candidatus Nanoarchaeia archaeon]MDD5239108.1 hypothetical protein [Candidatus Nanoarchaeia archaeon]
MLKKVNKPQKEYRGISLEDAVKYIDRDIFNDVIERAAMNVEQRNLDPYTKLNKEQVALRKKYFDSVPNPRKCLDLAKKYVDDIGLHGVTFGEPLFSGTHWSLEGKKGFPGTNCLPTVIKMPMHITDGVSTIEDRLLIEIQDFKGQRDKDPYDIDWNKIVWGARSIADIRVVQAIFEKKKRGYILIEVENMDLAVELAKKAYESDEIKSVSIWNREHMGSVPSAEINKIKPKEKWLNFLENKRYHSPEEIDNDWFINQNMEKFSVEYRNKVIVIQNSSIVGYGSTEESAVKNAKLNHAKVYSTLNFTLKEGMGYNTHSPSDR